MPPGTHPRKPPKNNICLWAPLGPPRDPQGSSRTSWKSRNLPKSKKKQRKPNTLYKKHKEYYGINDAHTNTHGSRSGLPYHRHTQRHTHTHTPTHPPTHTHIHAHTHTHTPEAFENIKFHVRRQRPSQRLYQRATGRVRDKLQRWTHVSDIIRSWATRSLKTLPNDDDHFNNSMTLVDPLMYKLNQSRIITQTLKAKHTKQLSIWIPLRPNLKQSLMHSYAKLSFVWL